jgi:hypothetical protein
MADWLARHMVNQLTKRVEELEKKLSEKTPEKLSEENSFDSSLVGEPYFGKLPY